MLSGGQLMDFNMPQMSIRVLKGLGVSDEDIELAKLTQSAQRRNNSRVQSIGEICGVTATPSRRKPQPNPKEPENFTDAAMKRRGTYDQAALLLEQQALRERSPERAFKARKAAKAAKELSASAQLEFDFFGGGNVSLAFEYHDTVTERLNAEREKKDGPSLVMQHQALAVLWTITRHMAWESYECTKTAADLCEITKIDKARMARILNLLEDVGGIKRVKRGRVKIITVTPEGAYRGKIDHHGKAVEKYKLEVVEGGKSDA
jgi:DNA-binding MarR family transcriptional regulator